jgi:uncharacterized membrane protein
VTLSNEYSEQSFIFIYFKFVQSIRIKSRDDRLALQFFVCLIIEIFRGETKDVKPLVVLIFYPGLIKIHYNTYHGCVRLAS